MRMMKKLTFLTLNSVTSASRYLFQTLIILPNQNRVMTHLDKRLGREHYYFIKVEDLDDFRAEQELLEEQMNITPVVEDIDYHDPEVQIELIKSFLSYEKNSMKLIDNPGLLVDQITTDADIIYYKYIFISRRYSTDHRYHFKYFRF